MSDLMLDVDQAGELKAAFRRGNWTNQEIKQLCEGDVLTKVHQVVKGYSSIITTEHIIDFDDDSFIFPTSNWSVLPDWEQLPNRIRGKMKFDSTKISLHLDDWQKHTNKTNGNGLLSKLVNFPVAGSQLLDFYLANQYFIPMDWKGKDVVFWGTIYCDSDGFRYVRYLYWDSKWSWCSLWIDNFFDKNYPAILFTS